MAPNSSSSTAPKPPTRPSRQYDIVVIGATGFTGELVVEYLIRRQTRRPNEKFKFAIAGRNIDKLHKVKQTVKQNLTIRDDRSFRYAKSKSTESSKSTAAEDEEKKKAKQKALMAKEKVVPEEFNPEYIEKQCALVDNIDTLLVKDLCTDTENLEKIVKSTTVILTTAGPFELYGKRLVELCAKYGTDYTDITGEANFVQWSIENVDKKAVENKARIVHCVGYDSLPSDLGCAYVLEEMKKRGGNEIGLPPAEYAAKDNSSTTPYYEVKYMVGATKGGVSGGTVATVVNGVRKARAEVLKYVVNSLSFLQKGEKLLEATAAGPEPSSKAAIGTPASLLIQKCSTKPGKDSSASVSKAENQDLIGPDQIFFNYDSDLDRFTVPWLMQYINTRIVNRTNWVVKKLPVKYTEAVWIKDDLFGINKMLRNGLSSRSSIGKNSQNLKSDNPGTWFHSLFVDRITWLITFLTAITSSVLFGLIVVMLFAIPGFDVMIEWWFPPGSGPNQDQLDNGFFTIHFFGLVKKTSKDHKTSSNIISREIIDVLCPFVEKVMKFWKRLLFGSKAGGGQDSESDEFLVTKVTLYMNRGDPGYRNTAKMISEASLRLLEIRRKEEEVDDDPGAHQGMHQPTHYREEKVESFGVLTPFEALGMNESLHEFIEQIRDERNPGGIFQLFVDGDETKKLS